MKAYLKRVWLSDYVRNVVTLVLGVGGAQLISIASMMILTRLYEPVYIGLLGVFTSIIVIARMIANGGYEASIVLPESDEDAAQLLYLCFLINGFITGLSFLFATAGQELIDYFYPDAAYLSQVIFLLPLSIFLEASSQALRYWHNRFKHYRIISLSKIFQAVTVALVSIIMGWQGQFIFGLIVGFVLGQAIAWGILFFKKPSFFSDYKINFSKIRRVAKTYKTFFRYGLIGSWFNSLSAQLPFFILPTLPMGGIMVGYYTIAHRIMYAPLNLVSSSISGVFYEKATSIHNEGRSLSGITKETTRYLLLMATIPIIVLMLFGPSIFGFVFGEEYSVAGEYARYLAPWFLVKFISHPISFLVDIKMKLGVQMIYNIIMFFVQYGVFVGVGLSLIGEDIIYYYSMVGLLMASVYMIYLLKLGEAFGKGTKTPN